MSILLDVCNKKKKKNEETKIDQPALYEVQEQLNRRERRLKRLETLLMQQAIAAGGRPTIIACALVGAACLAVLVLKTRSDQPPRLHAVCALCWRPLFFVFAGRTVSSILFMFLGHSCGQIMITQQPPFHEMGGCLPSC
jgi:glutathione S-transferase